jgi:hypothetical protein
LAEADYFLGVLHSESNARLCTEGYLVGHAQWFRGPGTEMLLDPIREWAQSHRLRSTCEGKLPS